MKLQGSTSRHPPPPPPPPYSNGKVALSRGWNASTCTPPSIHRSIDIILKSALSSSSRVASKRERRSIAWQLAEETSRSNEVYTLACGHFLLCNRFREIFEKFPFFWSVSDQILIYSLITSKKKSIFSSHLCVHYVDMFYKILYCKLF